MKSKSQILFIALIFSAYCCSPKGDGSVSIVDVGGNKVAVFSLKELSSKIETIPLSNLIEGCEMVKLDNRDEALLGRRCITTVSEKYIGIRADGQPYKLFDRTGKFICNVGAIGRGPGEYTISVYDDIIDDKNEIIYIAPFMGDKILVYNTSGKFLKNIDSPNRLQKPKLYLSNNILSVVHMPFQNDKAMGLQFDVNTGQVVRELAPPSHLITQSFDGEIFNTRNTPTVFDFVHTSSDTLYHFDIKNNKILPVFTISYTGSEQTYKQYIQLNKELFMANVSFLVTDTETGRSYYGNNKLVVTNMKSKTSSYANVVNDYFGGFSVPSSVVTFRNGYWVHNNSPEQLKANIEKRLGESSCTENEKQALTKLLLTINEEDNNVVFIGKLKSGVEANLW